MLKLVRGRESWPAHVPRGPSHAIGRGWLRDESSLTARLRARGERFSVQLLSQTRARPLRDEAVLLGIPPGRLALLREVLLAVDGVPRVYARSVMPLQALRQAWRPLAGLGERPLGAALFANPRVSRGPLHCRRLDHRDRRYHRALAAAGLPSAAPLWARRSRFRLRGHALLVTEIFLPAIADLPP